MNNALDKLQLNCKITSTVFSLNGYANSTANSVATGSNGPSSPDTSSIDQRTSPARSSSRLTPHSARANTPSTKETNVIMKYDLVLSVKDPTTIEETMMIT
mmetsp:Transcript_19711/g.35669  ORF Transcript_19711/g.35669 Transcript_19711/m.35669 type:complete len:101 (+) Transcript_19711:291-593(+)